MDSFATENGAVTGEEELNSIDDWEEKSTFYSVVFLLSRQ